MMDDLDIQNYRLKLQERLELNSTDIDALIALGALEFEHFRNDKQAIELLETAMKIDPKNIQAKFWLAMCLYYDCFEYAKAEKILQDALQLDPTRPECLSLMGQILRDLDKPVNETIQYVQKALSYAPDWPMLRYQLAGLYVDIGEINAAEQEVKKALEIPEFNSGISRS